MATLTEVSNKAAKTSRCAPESSKREMLRHLALIATCGAIVRILFHVTFKPFWSLDSPIFSNQFYYWSQHFYSTSYRPPVYALFLGIAQFLTHSTPIKMGMLPASLYCAVYLQSLLGLATALVVYMCLRLLDVNPRIALIGGLSFSLLGAVCVFELFVLTELVSLFFVSLSCLFFLRALKALRTKSSTRWVAAPMGLCFSLAILTRVENLVFVAVLIAVLLLMTLRCQFTDTLRWAASSLTRLAVGGVAWTAPLVLMWMFWNLVSIGQFRISILQGATRTETVYNLFDRVDPEDRVAGLILDNSYRETNQNGAVYRHHVWSVYIDLLDASKRGLLPLARKGDAAPAFTLKSRELLNGSFGLRSQPADNSENRDYFAEQPVELFDYLGDLSLRLAKRNPSAYLSNVTDNFISDSFSFSYPPPSLTETVDPQSPEGGNVVRNRSLYSLIALLNRAETPILRIIYVVVLAFVVMSPIVIFTGSDERLLLDGAACALAVAAFSVIVASCVLAAYYPQHGIPFLGIFVLIAFFAVQNRGRMINALKSPDAR